jgi:hypothetical protein
MPHRAGHPDDAGYMIGRCQDQATELAHIVPRGMGHKGDRDRLDNVMAACPLHARSTDDLSHQAWDGVPGWRSHVIDGEEVAPLMTRRQALAHYVNKQRRLAGVDVEASA